MELNYVFGFSFVSGNIFKEHTFLIGFDSHLVLDIMGTIILTFFLSLNLSPQYQDYYCPLNKLIIGIEDIESF